jgi:hypothetical protein
MRVPAWLRWYAGFLRQLAQPRDETVLERRGLARFLGARRAENGFGAMTWGSLAGALALVVLWSPLVGLWWLGLALLPIVFHCVARMVGTYREGHLV